MEVFRFKKFEVINADAGLKVGTDGVLLGAATVLPGQSSGHTSDAQIASSAMALPAQPVPVANSAPLRLLDIGTGTGLVALMLAQRLAEQGATFQITAIEIDRAAADIAARNFHASPWADSLQARHISLQGYFDAIYTRPEEDPISESDVPDASDTPARSDASAPAPLRFDLIVSNPPYFENSLKAPDAQRSTARHTDTLSYRECVTFAADYLAPQGSLSLILPKQEETALVRFASSFGLYPSRILDIRTTASKPPKRIVVQLGRTRVVPPVRQSLVLQDGTQRSAEFAALTADFYL